MRIGIDSYCFHRYFGDLWPGIDVDPGKRWEVFDFIAFAREVGVAGVSLETCFLPGLDAGFLQELRSALDDAGLDRVLAWGHPTGLECGTSPAALADLKRHIPAARALGTTTLRIVASLTRYSPDLEAQFSRDLVPVLREAVCAAADQGVVLAIENHGDFTADSLLRLRGEVNSPHLMVTLDTGNALRILEDPVEAARKLAPSVVATHIKDVTTGRGSPQDFLYWPATPVGKGAIDIPAILAILRAAGYSGLLCVEVDNPATAWRQTPEEDLVRLSVEYLREHVGSR
ncbi:MAG: sugar phosphate isomerase/epimerase [Chloroflexi bacterium]|nr:sugar phosphate isomerase/epimerase [Chloroflexota bacterium]